MSEMLGNQYFLGRHYYEAKNEFETEILKHPENLLLKKKLLICYTQTNQIEKALDLFEELIKKNIDIIVKTDPIRDDCPCPELVEKIKDPNKEFTNELDENIVNGIIWLYCDAEISLNYFKIAQQSDRSNKKLESVINIIQNFIEHKTTLNHTN